MSLAQTLLPKMLEAPELLLPAPRCIINPRVQDDSVKVRDPRLEPRRIKHFFGLVLSYFFYVLSQVFVRNFSLCSTAMYYNIFCM